MCLVAVLCQRFWQSRVQGWAHTPRWPLQKYARLNKNAMRTVLAVFLSFPHYTINLACMMPISLFYFWSLSQTMVLSLCATTWWKQWDTLDPECQLASMVYQHWDGWEKGGAASFIFDCIKELCDAKHIEGLWRDQKYSDQTAFWSWHSWEG